MDESFSLLNLDHEKYCREDSGRTVEVKHYVFEDLLDTEEKLLCNSYQINEEFAVFNYILKKEKGTIFSKVEEKKLGCYLGFFGGVILTFEDFNFKIESLEKFTLMTEAVEVTTGNSFFFELCNLCKLPETLPPELDVSISIYTRHLKSLPPLGRFDQMADENREILKLAVKGNPRASEKLERELGEAEAERLIKEFKASPEKLFDTCIIPHEGNYKVIGIVTAVNPLTVNGQKLYSVDIYSEELELNILTPEANVKVEERVILNGKMFGVAV
ncbi:MAG: hypothetical protein ABGX12_03825 [Desulfurobacteriaceae bacterium]